MNISKDQKKFLLFVIAVVVWYVDWTFNLFAPIVHEPGHYIAGLLLGMSPDFYFDRVVTYGGSDLQRFLVALAGPMFQITIGILINKKFAPIGWSFILFELYLMFQGVGDYANMEKIIPMFGSTLVFMYAGGYTWKMLLKSFVNIILSLSNLEIFTKIQKKRHSNMLVLKELGCFPDGTTPQSRKKTTTTGRQET